MEEMTRLPKNIRQIGDKDEMYRIYIEDYVHTFIRKLITSDDLTAKAGILFGTSATLEKKKCYFISGAAVIDDLWSELGELQFSEEVWEKIKETQREYFQDTNICGWFLRESEESNQDFVLIKQLHRSVFFKESLMFSCKEDEFALWIGAKDTTVSAVQGYYIYYERNPRMQEYMIGRSQEDGKRVERNVKDEAAQSFRTVMKEKKMQAEEKKLVLAGRVATAAAAVLLLAGVQIWRNRTGQAEHDYSGQAESQAVPVAATAATAADVEDTSTDESSLDSEESAEEAARAIEQSAGQAVPADAAMSASADEAAAAAASVLGEVSAAQTAAAGISAADPAGQAESGTENAEAAVSAGGEGRYVVKPGDTLISICVAHYGTTQMLQKLCEMNHISNANTIFVGQEIELP